MFRFLISTAFIAVFFPSLSCSVDDSNSRITENAKAQKSDKKVSLAGGAKIAVAKAYEKDKNNWFTLGYVCPHRSNS